MNRSSVARLFAIGTSIVLASACAAPASPSGSPGPSGSHGSPGPTAPGSLGSTQPSEAAPLTTLPDKLLTYAYAKDFSDFDPASAYGSENEILSQIYDTLTVFDPATGKILPSLATSWSSNADGTVWTFHLRGGVKFQDGTAFTADAVKFTINYAKQLNQGPAYLWDQVKQIVVVDPLTVEIGLTSPVPYDLVMSAAYGAYIMSPTADNQPKDWFAKGQGVGTGPYMWKSWQPGQGATITYFPGYWGGLHQGQFSTLVFNIVPEATTRLQDMLSSQADLTYNLALHQLIPFATNPQYKVVPLNIFGEQYLFLNTVRPPLDNVKVRQALLYSFPEDTVISSVYGAYGTKATSFVPTGIFGHTDPAQGYSYNLTMAKQLLTEGGYPNGGLTIDFVWTQSFPEQEAIAQLWKASLAQIGVTLNIRGLSFNAQNALLANPKTEPYAQMEFWTPTYPTGVDFMINLIATKGGGNWSQYTNPKVDSLIAQALTQSATDVPGATATLTQAQQLALNDAIGIPVVEEPQTFVTKSALSGFTSRDLGMYLYDLTSSP